MKLIECLSFSQFKELIVILDEQLTEIENEIYKSKDPDSDGLLDRAEYFVGVGFVAAQQVLVEATTFYRLDRDKAYKLGIRHKSGISYIRAINSAANYWKHEAEWWRDLEKLNNSSSKTRNDVGTIADTSYYQLSNLLFALSNDEEIRLKNLIPIIEEWFSVLKCSSK
jgi:hypothetical protein